MTTDRRALRHAVMAMLTLKPPMDWTVLFTGAVQAAWLAGYDAAKVDHRKRKKPCPKNVK